MMNSAEKKELRSRAKSLKAAMQIGKNGITPAAVEQLLAFLKKRKLVKVRLLNSFADEHDRREAAGELAGKTGSEIVDMIGFVVSLYKR